MVSFSMDPDLVPGLKVGLHSFQIILSFVTWCLLIVVLNAKEATVNGNIGWAFAVCFLSVPAWIFLIMTPRWQRSKRFAEPHAMLLVDALFIVLWLSAFASQAKFNADNKCGNACGPSTGAVALGVVVTLLFIASTLVSVYTLQHYQFHGMLPGYDKRALGKPPANYDPDKTAFSMAPDGDEPYARIGLEDPDQDRDHDHDHLAHVNDGDDSRIGGGSYGSRYGGGGGSALDSDLSGGYGASSIGNGSRRQPTPGFEDARFSPRPDEPGYNSRISSPAVPFAHSPGADTPYDSDGVARFPDANYAA